MRFVKDEINKNFDTDFTDYLIDYIEEIESLGCVFIDVDISDEPADIEHHVYQFKLAGNFRKDETIMCRDDDSQPHNSYRIYMGDLFIYETRYN